MTPYLCIKTSDIPLKDLPEWGRLNDILEMGNNHLGAWSKTILSENYVFFTFRPGWGLVGTSTKPANIKPLTLELFRKLVFLKLTGDCNDDIALCLSSSSQG